MKHKNDYSCIVFYKDQKPKKWKYVHTISSMVSFLNLSYPGWSYINVYERRTGRFLKRVYPGDIAQKFINN